MHVIMLQIFQDRDRVGDVADNCVNLANADQRDLDRDKKGDVCDLSQRSG